MTRLAFNVMIIGARCVHRLMHTPHNYGDGDDDDDDDDNDDVDDNDDDDEDDDDNFYYGNDGSSTLAVLSPWP